MERRFEMKAGRALLLNAPAGCTLRIEHGELRLAGELGLLAGQPWQLRQVLRQGETLCIAVATVLSVESVRDSIVVYRAQRQGLGRQFDATWLSRCRIWLRRLRIG
ncbi:hypothetical protein [Chitinolyticbacter albus]|uniref:hypothetical protein n=1 Tax=Chitinolyticbacter albus TaxID=2961951 RepID=UPI00210D27A9|nr:hypothetical protein [Chitinolyticbacter albus]